ncbi:hypothetical protein D1007_14864 [Hordeum vulgare]|nr:hypothetical protein D1007_14864 [Hordeum vulgare]
MPQKGEVGGGSWGSLVPATPLPALERSSMVNLEGLEKVRLVVAANCNEWGATQIRLGSWPRGERVSSAVPLNLHALLSGVLPPFSSFFDAVLSYYQIHALHLDPCSLILLSTFAFWCEAFVGMAPSVAFLRHFCSLELASNMKCSGCVSLKIGDAPALGITAVKLLPEAEGFRRQWVLVKAAGGGALLQPPTAPPTPKWGWECEELSDPRLALILTQLGQLRLAGVSMAMVVREFICRRIALLRRHSRLMWANGGPNDSMRTRVASFSPDVLRELLPRLTGSNPNELPPDGQMLYRPKYVKDLAAEMPIFDEWRLLPDGKEHSQGVVSPGFGPHEDPERVVSSWIMVGDASTPTPRALAPRRAMVGGDDWAIMQNAASATVRRSRATEHLSRGAPASRKRKLSMGGRVLARGAPARKKWMAIDE